MQYSLRQYRAQAESHSHSDFHQIIISDLGCLELEIEGRGGEVCGRQMAFVEAGQTHAFRAEGLNRFLVLDVEIQLAQRSGIEALWQKSGNASAYLEVLTGYQGGLVGLLDGQNTRTRMQISDRETIAAGDDSSDMLGALRHLLSHSRQTIRRAPDAATGIPPRLIRVTAWAETRLAEDICISDMARIAAQSESSLFTAFQQYLGTSPMRWLAEQRLQTALAMLQDEQIDLSIGDLACAVGYTDQSAFSRAFSRRFGCSPVMVRNKIGRSRDA